MGALLLLRRPEELHGWTNALRGGVEDCTNTTITDDWNMKILAHLPSVFDRHRQQKTPGHPGLKPDWKNTTDVFVAQLKPHIASEGARRLHGRREGLRRRPVRRLQHRWCAR